MLDTETLANQDETNLKHSSSPQFDLEESEAIGDEHIGSSIETPLRPDAFDRTDKEKKQQIEYHFREIMLTLGLDLEDDSLQGTPKRVAKMYVEEIFQGLNPENKPNLKTFDNKYKYDQMLIEKNISYYSSCEHHFLPIMGKAHVAYISSGKVIGLSKINRLVRYYAQRPQVQERMTVQILATLQEALDTEDVAVIVEGKHLCVSARGIQDDASSTTTSAFGGIFLESTEKKNEFLQYIKD